MTIENIIKELKKLDPKKELFTIEGTRLFPITSITIENVEKACDKKEYKWIPKESQKHRLDLTPIILIS